MASNSKVCITIGCDGSEDQEKYTSLHVSGIFAEEKLNSLGSQYRKILELKKMPMLLIEIDQKWEEDLGDSFVLFGEEFQIKNKNFEGHTYIWGQMKNKDKSLTLRKIEKIFHLLTSLPNYLHLNFKFYDFQNQQGSSIGKMLQKCKIQGDLDFNFKTIDVVKKCIGKVSPQFNQSPIMAILEVFHLFNFNLNLDSLQIFDEQNKQTLLTTFFRSEGKKQSEVDKKLGSLDNKNVKIMFGTEKLFYFQFSGLGKLLGSITKFL